MVLQCRFDADCEEPLDEHNKVNHCISPNLALLSDHEFVIHITSLPNGLRNHFTGHSGARAISRRRHVGQGAQSVSGSSPGRDLLRDARPEAGPRRRG